ncbi:ROK family protein [Mycolicibacterium hippocampi]|uniref:ROK family protein n=1 Tax=Mycolicibacterium hippocampi TaxID=659824 RepID=UPI003514D079
MRATTTVSKRHRVVSPPLSIPAAAGASVFAAARMRGPIARDAISRVTSLSIATVNRQVGALLDAGLLCERPDLSASGAIGRPRIPVEVNHPPFMTLGVHIGARTTSVVAIDLLGRILDAIDTPTPQGDSATALESLAETVKRYRRRWHKRQVLWLGIAVGGLVDRRAGTVTHPRLGWSSAPVGAVMADRLGLPTSVASHVDAMAAAEVMLGLRRFDAPSATDLYVYARETVGYALVIDGKVHTPARGPGSIAGLPVHRDLLGHPNTLESAVSDDAVVNAARSLRIPPSGGDYSIASLLRAARTGQADAGALLAERGRVLGEAIALLRDLLNPDGVVVGGQAFTAYPPALDDLEAAFAGHSVLPAMDIRVTAFGDRVQGCGAGVVSLSALYADPVGGLRRAQVSSMSGGEPAHGFDARLELIGRRRGDRRPAADPA